MELAFGVLGLALLAAATGLVELAMALWYRHVRARSRSSSATLARIRVPAVADATSRSHGRRARTAILGAMHLELVALVVRDYDEAIAFFVDTLQFSLVEDSPSLTNDGRPKRWVVVRPPGAQTGLLLARADGESQREVVGGQHGGRVGFFLRVDDFDAAHGRMQARGVEFVTAPRDEPYGRLAVFIDVAGNRWDLLGPRPPAPLPAA